MLRKFDRWSAIWLVGMVLMLVVICVPIFVMFKYAISDRASIVTGGEVIPLWPYHPTLEMFRSLMSTDQFLRAGALSLQIALMTVALSLLLGTPAAFALARHNVPAKGMLLIALISVRLFPDVVAVVPLTEYFAALRLHGTAFGVSLAHSLLSMPYVIYISMAVFEEIPRDLEEQAHVLGAGRLYAFVKIVLPIAMPGLAAAAIYCFLLSWDEFIFSYFLLFFSETFTLPVHLQKILSWSPQQNLLAAVAVILSVPVIVFTFIIQKYMRTGLTAGAVK